MEKSSRLLSLELFIVSFTVLFQELALIRWLPGQVRVLAYFPNLILISSFLGLGIGSLRAGRRSLLWSWPVGLLVVVGVAYGLQGIAFTQESVTEHLWFLYEDLGAEAPVIQSIRLPVLLFFVLNALCFLGPGQLVAERLKAMGDQSATLWGYSWDLTGSLVGVIVFAVVAFTGAFPIVWFGVVGVGVAVFIGFRARRLAVFVPILAVLLTLVVVAEKAEQYSPYYALSTLPRDKGPGFSVLTNGSHHQKALPLAKADAADSPRHAQTRADFHQPFQILKSPPKRALVLGAGTGNDVAVLLDEGVEHVDAVEIDPVILAMGEADHPNHPYSSPKVTLHNTDARSFLNETNERYDLILFGTLDSMTRLAALSNVRLDNFVYTTDCLRAARALLTDNGGIVMLFWVEHEYIENRLAGMLAKAFGEAPHMGKTNPKLNGLFNTVFMAGPAFAHSAPPWQEHYSAKLEKALETLELPSDDWPFLYLENRGISGFYLSIIGLILLISGVGVFAASPELRSSVRTGQGIDGVMFFFGMAFLLLETRSITELNLLWGATWLTSAVVFGAILLMVLLGTIVTQLKPIPWWASIGGLFASLLAAYWIPIQPLLALEPAARLGASMLIVGAPIFFASTSFALCFKERADPGIAFGWNLLGAVTGGLVEFLSMILGIKTMLLVALVAYLIVVLLRQRTRAPQTH
jgi:spermidine synthase